METKEMLKRRIEMCKSLKNCEDCVLNVYKNTEAKNCVLFIISHPKEAEEIIAKWVKERRKKNVERESVNNCITLDTQEIEAVLNIRDDGKYCKFTDDYLITVTRR